MRTRNSETSYWKDTIFCHINRIRFPQGINHLRYFVIYKNNESKSNVPAVWKNAFAFDGAGVLVHQTCKKSDLKKWHFFMDEGLLVLEGFDLDLFHCNSNFELYWPLKSNCKANICNQNVIFSFTLAVFQQNLYYFQNARTVHHVSSLKIFTKIPRHSSNWPMLSGNQLWFSEALAQPFAPLYRSRYSVNLTAIAAPLNFSSIYGDLTRVVQVLPGFDFKKKASLGFTRWDLIQLALQTGLIHPFKVWLKLPSTWPHVCRPKSLQCHSCHGLRCNFPRAVTFSMSSARPHRVYPLVSCP